MATQNNEFTKYEKLKAGHAIALGIEDLDNMTEEQEHALANRLEANGIVKPQSAPALPGTAINPSAGSEIAPTTKGRAKRTSKNAVAADNVSPAAYDGDVMRILEHYAREGDAVGALASQIYRGAIGRRIQSEMATLTIDSTVSSGITGSADSFLDGWGL